MFSFFSLQFQALVGLPVVHHKLFVYICAFLRKLLEHSANNKLEVNALGKPYVFLKIYKMKLKLGLLFFGFIAISSGPIYSLC